MVKEDAAIPVIGLGVYMFFSNFKKQGIAVFLLGFLWLLVSVELIIPYYRSLIGKTGYGFWSYWTEYGATQQEILWNMINPVKNLSILFKGEKLNSMINFFSVFLFLPFGSVKAFVLLVFPNWFLLFSSGNSMMYNAQNYYGLLSVPFLFFSSILILNKILKKFRSEKAVIIIISLMLFVNAANSRFWKLFIENPMRYSERYETAKHIISIIPNSAGISAQANLVAHIKPREQRVFFPQELEKSEYIFLDLKGDKWPLSEAAYMEQVNHLKNSGVFKIEFEENEFILFKNMNISP